MKYLIKGILIISFVIGFSEIIFSQVINVSQKASVMQRIKNTDITVEYHRPTENGRNIWGGVVPYEFYWRGGANEATIIKISKNVEIGGINLEPGVYGFFAYPRNNKDWDLIFTKANYVWGNPYPGEEHEIVRVKSTPEERHHVEQLMYYFEDVKSNSGKLVLHWGNKAIPFEIIVK